MIQRRRHKVGIAHRAPVRLERGRQDPVVGGVGKGRLMMDWIVVERIGARAARCAGREGVGVRSKGTYGSTGRYSMGRSCVSDRPKVLGDPVGVLAQDVQLGDEVIGGPNIGHFGLVRQGGLRTVKRRGQREDRAAVLDRGDAPGGEAPAVARAVDEVDDRECSGRPPG